MSRLPSLDAYDLQGIRDDEAAQYSDEIREALDDLDPVTGEPGFGVAYD